MGGTRGSPIGFTGDTGLWEQEIKTKETIMRRNNLFILQPFN